VLTDFEHHGNDPEFHITFPLDEETLKNIFDEDWINIIQRPGSETSYHRGNYVDKFVDEDITMILTKNEKPKFHESCLSLDRTKQGERYRENLLKFVANPLAGKRFKRLRAERDIKSEGDFPIDVNEEGDGATYIIQNYITRKGLRTNLVKDKLLNELNKITRPDSNFSGIDVQRDDNNKWEIYLEEATKGPVALSRSGSGLKTIILLLIYTILIPDKEDKKLSDYIFAFEELENNLHPSLQRRLLLYLRDTAVREHTHIFLTTHSNVVIDLFSNDPNAQIYHITHDGDKAFSNPVMTYPEKSWILDDLDIRASDLLQSNGVIWVEGPSDRLYINRWIELWSEDIKLREGAHYQCIFYGGRLLSHLSAETSEDDRQDLINILSTNRNSAILIDSDKKYRSDKINSTKRRICEEIKTIDGICWITKGKEIENYIPKSAIDSLAEFYGTNVENKLELYGVFDEYLKQIDPGKKGRKKFPRDKVSFAQEIRPYLNKENCESIMDLDSRMNELVARIKRWNALDNAK